MSKYAIRHYARFTFALLIGAVALGTLAVALQYGALRHDRLALTTAEQYHQAVRQTAQAARQMVLPTANDQAREQLREALQAQQTHANALADWKAPADAGLLTLTALTEAKPLTNVGDFLLNNALRQDSTVQAVVGVDTAGAPVLEVQTYRTLTADTKRSLSQIEKALPLAFAASDALVGYWQAEVTAQQRALSGWFTVLCAGLILALLGGLLSFERYVFRPLREVSQTAQRIAEGDYRAANTTSGRYEFGMVVRAYTEMLANLRRVRAFIKQIGANNLEATLEGIEETRYEGTDTLEGDLLAMRQQLREVAMAEEKRHWATEGAARFAEMFRAQDQRLEDLSGRVLSELIKYLGANQGAVYVARQTENDEPVMLDLVGCYAYGRHKHRQDEVAAGQGLVGQAYLEARPINLTEIPADYLKITSGLGEALPRNLLLLPLTVNEHVYGILELASFAKFESHHLQFLEKISEGFAATLANARTAERTRRLLEESQNMTEELRAQEEEMRQNMEELAATQEELHRKSLENEAFTSSIDRSSVIIDFDGTGTIINVNDKFCRTTGYTREEIVGQKHTYYIPPEDIKQGAFESLWEQLRQTDYMEKDVRRMRKDGTPFWLRAYYFPIRDEGGQLMRINCICSDITQEVEAREQMQQQQQHTDEAQRELRNHLEQVAEAQAETEKALKELQRETARYVAAFDLASEGVATIDAAGTLQTHNAAFRTWLGASEASGDSLAAHLSDRHEQALAQALAGTESRVIDERGAVTFRPLPNGEVAVLAQPVARA